MKFETGNCGFDLIFLQTDIAYIFQTQMMTLLQTSGTPKFHLLVELRRWKMKSI